ncbi:MAG: hypothetical protein U5K37_03830 [Natrialbaceae archaeon]|nr:hypothetical protein [Natrialbaceae archaeon]
MGEHNCSTENGDESSPMEFDRFESISLSPTEHERLMTLVHGAHLKHLCGHERRYLIAGAGSGDEFDRRVLVYRQLRRANESLCSRVQTR